MEKALIRLIVIGIVCGMSLTVFAQDDDTELPTIEAYTAETSALLLELETNGIIPSGGEEIFTQGSLTYSGDAPQFSTFALENTAQNVLFGATLTFDPSSDELEFCAIGLRAEREERTQTEDGDTVTTIRLPRYLAVAVDNNAAVVAFERGTDEESALTTAEDQIVLNETPIYLLAVLLNDTLTVYADGLPIIEDYAVTLDGTAFAFLYGGQAEESSCTVEQLFAYRFADELVTACTITTDSPINQRQGPGTEFARITQLQAGERIEAIGQTIGNDGFIWWQLSDETWVRDDVVDTIGFCRPLPQVTENNS